MASTLALERLIGTSVGSTLGAAFKVLDARIRQFGQLSNKRTVELDRVGQSLGVSSELLDPSAGDPAGTPAYDAQGSVALLKRIAGHVQVISFKVADIARGRSQSRVSLLFVKVGREGTTQPPALAPSVTATREADVPAPQSTDEVAPPAAGASSSVWSKASGAFDGAMNGVDDALRPATDRLAVGITHIANGFTALSDNAKLAVMGAAAAGATLVTLKTPLNAFKLSKGLLEIGRDLQGGDGGEKDAEKAGGTVLDTVLKVVDAFGEAMGGDDAQEGSEPQKVFVLNAQDFCCGAINTGGGRRSKKKRGNSRSSSSRSPPPSPAPAPAAGWAKIKGYLGKAGTAMKGVRAPAALEAVYKAGKTFLTAETAEQKAEGYGGAVGGFGGALAGAAMGAFVPVVGPAIGAVIGGIAGTEWGASLAKKWFAGDEATKPAASEPAQLSRSLGEVARSIHPGAGEPMTMLSLPPALQPVGPAPQPITQQITFAPHMPITVQGSVTDAAQLALNIEPIVRRQFDEMTRMAANRQLADPTHV